MIAIVNVSKCDKNKNCDGTGLYDYEVRINHDIITKFTHRREDGLAACLLKARKAVLKQEGMK